MVLIFLVFLTMFFLIFTATGSGHRKNTCVLRIFKFRFCEYLAVESFAETT